MLEIFLKTLPFFALIALGYWAGRTRFFTAEATAYLTKFVFYFALSAMLFRFAANLSLTDILDWTFVLAYFWATAFVYLIVTAVALLRWRPIDEAAIEAQCGVIGNVGFLGVPMLVLLMGEGAIGPVMLVLAVDLIFFGSLVVILITGSRDGRMSLGVLKTVGTGLIKNPMIVSIVLGFTWSAMAWPIPGLHDRATLRGCPDAGVCEYSDFNRRQHCDRVLGHRLGVLTGGPDGNHIWTFGLFQPAEARDGPVPVLWYLSGLTCTHENAMVKAGAQGWAAEQGIALIFPDTSPRGEGVANDDAYDLGQGAGFYVNATQDPWAKHFQMYDYITKDLTELVFNDFALDAGRQAITGHSMGGHGALTIAMQNPGRFASMSAFAPICNPTGSDWGKKQFSAYLGSENGPDASVLMAEKGFDGPVLIDTGTEDQFLDLLKPETLAQAAATRRQQMTFRMQPGYDHSYFFVSTFMEDHVTFHAEALYS